MKRYSVLLASFFLAGCAMTPENQRIWAEVLQSAAQGVNQANQDLRRGMEENNRQNPYQQIPSIAPRQVNCTTTYNSLMRAYETQCQ
jgi:hypothetical protein